MTYTEENEGAKERQLVGASLPVFLGGNRILNHTAQARFGLTGELVPPLQLRREEEVLYLTAQRNRKPFQRVIGKAKTFFNPGNSGVIKSWPTLLRQLSIGKPGFCASLLQIIGVKRHGYLIACRYSHTIFSQARKSINSSYSTIVEPAGSGGCVFHIYMIDV